MISWLVDIFQSIEVIIFDAQIAPFLATESLLDLVDITPAIFDNFLALGYDKTFKIEYNYIT